MPLRFAAPEYFVYQWGIPIVVSLVAAILDVRTRRIPNALTASLLVAGLARAAYLGGWAGLGDSVAACALLALPYVLLFLFSGCGAGDAKLMAALGAWLGLGQGAIVFVCVATAGIVLAVVKAAANGHLGATLRSIFVTAYTFVIAVCGGPKAYALMRDGAEEKPHDQSVRIEVPYGAAIFAGVCAAAAIVLLWREC